MAHRTSCPRIGRAGRGRSVGLLLVVCLALSGGLAACGGSSSASSNSITLYNGQHEQTTDALVSQFEKATGVKVKIRSDDEDVFASQITAEGGHSPADVLFTENSPPLEFLQQNGLLAPVPASTLAHTPSRYNSPTGHWVGVSARVSVLVYNTRLLKPSQLPTSVMELADPKWKGKLGIAPGETDFQPIVTSVARTYGEAAALRWLRGLKANAGSAHSYPDNETLVDRVNRGEVALGMINQYYWYRERAQVGASDVHSAIAHLAPRDPGYVIDVSGAAVLKSSGHQADAQKFLAFLVSAQGQKIIATTDSFEYPIASGVTTGQPETPLDKLQADPINIAALGDGATAIALLQKAQLL
jgi:iron(III) transport system substrate-binding protein